VRAAANGFGWLADAFGNARAQAAEMVIEPGDSERVRSADIHQPRRPAAAWQKVGERPEYRTTAVGLYF
jgi:hypothetical protein